MSTNDEPEATDTQVEEVSQDAVADLAAAKAEAEDTKTKAEVSEDEVKPEPTPESEVKTEETLTTEDHDLDWYKKAYDNSTKEALRLKGELDKKDAPAPVAVPEIAEGTVLTPEQLYVRTQLIKDSDQAFAKILQKYPDANNTDVRERFKQTSEQISKVIVDSENRFPEALELYEKTAIILGLTPDNSEALSAIKDSTSTTKTASTAAVTSTQSKVSEEMISANLKMYPGKSRQEIIEELEPHIN